METGRHNFPTKLDAVHGRIHTVGGCVHKLSLALYLVLNFLTKWPACEQGSSQAA